MCFDSYLGKLKSVVCDISLVALFSLLIIMFISVYIEDDSAIVVSAILFSLTFVLYTGYVIYTKEIKLRIPIILFLAFIYIGVNVIMEIIPVIGYQVDPTGVGYGDELVRGYFYFFKGLLVMLIVFIGLDAISFIANRYNQVIEAK